MAGILALGTSLLGAQSGGPGTGTLSGRVLSQSTGMGVPNATLTVATIGLTGTSDLSGNFTIAAVPAGTVDLIAVKPSFQTVTIAGIAVTAGQLATVEIPLSPAGADEVYQMDALTVSAGVVQGSQLGLLLSRQNSASVTDAIGSDLLSRLSIGNAGEAMAKVTGASIVDGKHIFIRGLGDRYTHTQLNNSPVPSADPDRRSVQMDQFPSDVIDSITTLKSFTPDQPGAFSGGSVNIKTKPFPEQFFFNVSAATAYNSNVTGEDILSVPGGGQDWQGRDDGTRALSSVVPNPMPSNLTSTAAILAARQGNFELAEQIDAISQSFHNEAFFPRPKKAQPDFGFSLAIGDSFTLGRDQTIGYIASLTYDRTTEHYTNGITGRYSQGSVNPDDPSFVDLSRVFTTNIAEYNFGDLYHANPRVPGGTPAFGVTSSSQNVDWGSYLQLAWKPSGNHEFKTTFFHNQSAQDSVERGIGEATRSDSGAEFREVYDLLYTERGITSLQVVGKSNFPSGNDSILEWRAAVSRSTQDQPDYRSFQFKWSFILQNWDPSGITHNRFFRQLEEDSRDFGVDFTRPFAIGGRDVTLKVGAAHFEGARTNRERAFQIQGTATRTRDEIEHFPHPVGITSRTANAVTFGTVMREIIGNLNYDGAQTFSAGYAMGDLRWNERWRFIAGARVERTEVITTPLLGAGVAIQPGEIRQTDALPALSVVWAPRDRQNVRLSYGRTLARPTFREMADVINFEAFTDEFIGGNPDLELTIIDNFDLRWERFPGGNEVLAASLFYKKLDRPIESVFDQGRIFPNNVEEGVVYGLELEARRKLDFVSDALANLALGFNASFIESEVKIPANELALIRAAFPDADDTRELFGQSPFILNVDATYDLPAWGTTFTAVFGVFGERLDLVTTGALPDVYEQPAPSLDFNWSQRISDRWRLKFAARNLLDPPREKTLQHGGTTYYYERYRRGRSFSLSVSYSFQ